MSERIRAHQSPLIPDVDNSNEVLEASDRLLKKGVCEPSTSISDAALPTEVPSPLARPSNRLIAQLNKNWRIVDDPLQWILQRRKGNPRKKNSGWQDRSFCTTREGLVRCIRESCGEVDADTLSQLRALPQFHPDREPSR